MATLSTNSFQKRESPDKVKGSIFLNDLVLIAGAGPGDPDLITLQVKKACEQAEVVLADRLVHAEIFKCFVNPKAKVVMVGKAYNQPESVPQEETNQLLLRYAQSGLRTLRLKGGDVSLFSNVYDEIRILRAHRIAFRLLAGISAMSGIAAHLGIPLTARKHSSRLEILMYGYGAKSDEERLEVARSMVQEQKTTVLFMSTVRLPEMLTHLFRALQEKQKATSDSPQAPYWMAIVEQGTTPSQRVCLFDLTDAKKQAALFESIKSVQRPALIITGKVLEILEICDTRATGLASASASEFDAPAESEFPRNV